LLLYGLVILTPTAAYPVYGIVEQTSRGHAALSYLVAMVAMLFTAASYGKMSGAYPATGSTYTYTQQALNPHIGFLAGWAMILDYLLIPLLSVIYAPLTAERMLPNVPYFAWAVAFTIAITMINVRGIRVTRRANTVMVLIMTVCATLFVCLAASWIIQARGAPGLIDIRAIYRPDIFGLAPLMLGAAIASPDDARRSAVGYRARVSRMV
jgi:amino acid transporter